MAESISLKQNLPENLNCLAAQRALYSKAKKIINTQILLGVPVTVGISVVALILTDATLAHEYHFQQIDISWFVAFLSVIVSLFDFLVFSPWADQTKEEAAKIQELFVCSVLGSSRTRVGELYQMSEKNGTILDEERVEGFSRVYLTDYLGFPSHL